MRNVRKRRKKARLKLKICEEIEAIDFATLTTYASWDEMTKSVIALQRQWKTLGFASRKVNAELFTRFRKSCDEFFAKKAEFFKAMKDELSTNLQKKEALCEKAEALKDSTDWKKTADILIALQKSGRLLVLWLKILMKDLRLERNLPLVLDFAEVLHAQRLAVGACGPSIGRGRPAPGHGPCAAARFPGRSAGSAHRQSSTVAQSPGGRCRKLGRTCRGRNDMTGARRRGCALFRSRRKNAAPVICWGRSTLGCHCRLIAPAAHDRPPIPRSSR